MSELSLSRTEIEIVRSWANFLIDYSLPSKEDVEVLEKIDKFLKEWK